MKVVRLEVGYLETNCYIVYDEVSKQAVIIDPGGSEKKILAIIAKENLQVKYIINTHGHVDHIAANSAIKEATKAQILIHSADAAMLTNPQSNLSSFVGNDIKSAPPDRLLEEGEVIKAGSLEFNVLHTPGHTPGGICLKIADTVFCGDTIFYESIGRTDFPGGSYSQLINGIKTKIMGLEDSTKLMPGHEPETTVGWERRRNPFLQ